jgi:hypothetical protein
MSNDSNKRDIGKMLIDETTDHGLLVAWLTRVAGNLNQPWLAELAEQSRLGGDTYQALAVAIPSFVRTIWAVSPGHVKPCPVEEHPNFQELLGYPERAWTADGMAAAIAIIRIEDSHPSERLHMAKYVSGPMMADGVYRGTWSGYRIAVPGATHRSTVLESMSGLKGEADVEVTVRKGGLYLRQV